MVEDVVNTKSRCDGCLAATFPTLNHLCIDLVHLLIGKFGDFHIYLFSSKGTCKMIRIFSFLGYRGMQAWTIYLFHVLELYEMHTLCNHYFCDPRPISSTVQRNSRSLDFISIQNFCSILENSDSCSSTYRQLRCLLECQGKSKTQVVSVQPLVTISH